MLKPASVKEQIVNTSTRRRPGARSPGEKDRMREPAGAGAGACVTILVIMAILLIVGGIGQATTHGYPCHWIRVGDSQVCQ